MEATHESAQTSVSIEVTGPGRWLARVEGRPLPMEQRGDVPKVRDLEFAEFLGYEHPRQIRELIQRMEVAGKLKDVEVCRTVRQTQGGRPGSERWLTRIQCLLLATQSDTPQAWALTEHIVRVFELATSERVAPEPVVPTVILAQLVQQQGQALTMLASLTARLERVEAHAAQVSPSTTDGTIGWSVARDQINKPVRAIARHLVDVDPSRSYRGHLHWVHHELRRRLSMAMSPPWDRLRWNRLGDVRDEILAMLRDIARRHERIRESVQRTIDAEESKRQPNLPNVP